MRFPSSHEPCVPDVILANPVAGGGAARANIPALQAFALAQGWRMDMRITQSPEHLAQEARAAISQGHTRIFALGGDGTFQDLINATVATPSIVLGILPAGGGNDLAKALGLPGNPLQSAQLLLDGEVRSLDAARVRTADGRERLFTGGGGVGLDAEAAQFASGSFRNIRGRSRYVLSGLRALAGFHAVDVQVRIDSGQSETVQAKVLLLGILNTPSYGAGLRFAPDAKTDDGLLDLVLVEKLSLLEILKLLPRVISRGEIRTTRLQRFSVRRVSIETTRPCRFHGDGEILGFTPVEIEVVPGAIQILCPAVSRFQF